MERIGLLQIDGKMPNLALMKLASWHRQKGDEVVFIDLSSIQVDRWYGSKVFMGGSGYDLKATLPADIEAQTPDYELFNLDHSIGFTSRGCIKDCGFCIVREKEGKLFEVDFSKDIKHSKYIIMDNNFLASPKWKQKLKYFIDNKIQVCFTQGLDITLITKEKADLLSKVDSRDRKFKRKRLYFAFDDPKIEDVFCERLEILLQYIKPWQVMVYMIVGYNTTFKQDMYRFEIISSYGCDPFVMMHENGKSDKQLRNFARWVNKRIYKVDSFENYGEI